MRLIAGLIGFLALLAAAALGGLMLAAWLSGIDPAQQVGSLWFAMDADSLGATQAAVERHIWPPLWTYIIFPVLQLSAPVTAVVTFVVAMVLLFFSRGGNGGGPARSSSHGKRGKRLFKR